MPTRTAAVTNARLNKVLVELAELIRWADEDAQHAYSHGATKTAADDDYRANQLGKAQELVGCCVRDE